MTPDANSPMVPPRPAAPVPEAAAAQPPAGNPVIYLPSLNRISWDAISAGVALALTIQLAFSLLGLGIGLRTMQPIQAHDPLAGIGMGAGIWWMVTSLLSLYLGATVASRLAGIPRPIDGILHGLLTWAVVTGLTLTVLTTVVSLLLGGVAKVADRVLAGMSHEIAAVAPKAADVIVSELQGEGIDMSNVKRDARLLLRQPSPAASSPQSSAQPAAKAKAVQSPANASATADNFDDVIDHLTRRADHIGDATDREEAVNVVSQRTGKSRAEALPIVDSWIATARRARAKVEAGKKQAAAVAFQTADKVAASLSKLAALAALGLGLGAAVTAFGGYRATPKAVVTGPATPVT